jgi:hypothetical protein
MYYFSIPFQDFIKIKDIIRRWEERIQNISIYPGLSRAEISPAIHERTTGISKE